MADEQLNMNLCSCVVTELAVKVLEFINRKMLGLNGTNETTFLQSYSYFWFLIQKGKIEGFQRVAAKKYFSIWETSLILESLKEFKFSSSNRRLRRSVISANGS